MKQYFVFKWVTRCGETVLTLHDRSREDAMKIALEMGYVPFSWWKPRTWHNYCYAFANDIDNKNEFI